MSDVITIDCDYIHPRFAAAYLLVEGDRALFIENNTAHSVPRLLSTLASRGLKPEQVDYLIITHVHLDHAGGTSALLKACPNAQVLAHPRAARHVIDPSVLVASAREVYGQARFAELYGEINPVPAARVREMQDGEELVFGTRTLRFLHTRGHANHHFCVYDSGSKGIFTGDAFGLAYPDLQKNGLFIFPSTSPTDFDPDLAIESIDRIVGTGAERAYLTHYGEVTALTEAARQLKEHLAFCARLLVTSAESPLADAELDAFCEEHLRKHFELALARSGVAVTPAVWELLRLDIELNAQGIAHVARKRRKKGK